MDPLAASSFEEANRLCWPVGVGHPRTCGCPALHASDLYWDVCHCGGRWLWLGEFRLVLIAGALTLTLTHDDVTPAMTHHPGPLSPACVCDR